MDYISQKQSFVWNYEKDKRELFDREPELRDNKKNNEMHLDELEEKYALRKNKLTGQYETVKNSIKEKTAERDAIKNDFSVLENFRKDEGFCPPESYTPEELPTNNLAGKIVEKLKSLLFLLARILRISRNRSICLTVILLQEILSVSLSHCRVVP